MPSGKAAKQADFAKWALPHMDHLYNTGLYLARNREEAEDLVQETFLRAYRFWHQFTPGTNCRAWLLTILYNTFRNRYRDRSRQQRMVDIDDAEGAIEQSELIESPVTPEQQVLGQLMDGEVQNALRQLPQEYLDAVVLVDLQELRYEEAAQVLDCPIGTVRSRLFRGRRLLQKHLMDYAAQRGIVRGKE